MKMLRQPRYCVRKPPMKGPADRPVYTAATLIPSTRPRSRAGYTAVSSAAPVPNTMAAPSNGKSKGKLRHFALSVPDPRERPLEKQQAADQAHLRFRDERSDFLSFIALWEFFAAELARASSEPPAVLRERVTSKGGTTHAALTHMEAMHVGDHFQEALEKARIRAAELGREFG